MRRPYYFKIILLEEKGKEVQEILCDKFMKSLDSYELHDFLEKTKVELEMCGSKGRIVVYERNFLSGDMHHDQLFTSVDFDGTVYN